MFSDYKIHTIVTKKTAFYAKIKLQKYLIVKEIDT